MKKDLIECNRDFFDCNRDLIDRKLLYKGDVIYKNHFKYCSGVYIGETGRCFNTYLSEHKCDLKTINMAKLKEDD